MSNLEPIAQSIRDTLDEVFPDAASAAAFLGVGRDYFRAHYWDLGFKQGSSMTFRKSELLERREQLRREAGDER